MSAVKIENLLIQVIAINEKYKKIAQLTGANFNIFNILDLKTKEVRLHSAFIAELLNPYGSHGQKDIFLKLFLNCIEIKFENYNPSNVFIEIEKYIGPINENFTEGGRIDISVKIDEETYIFIENKIYANDQKNQLLRYHNYDKNAKIIYLTLDGKDAEENYGFDNIKVSYKKEILNWLELCLKETALLPSIRETLFQYINIVKQLTNQTMENSEILEIKKIILKNPEYAEAIKKSQDALTSIIVDFNDKFINLFKYKNIVLIDKTEINKFILDENFCFY